VRWNNGQISKNYKRELLPKGRFDICSQFEAAIKPKMTVELTIGPGRGFKNFDLNVEYDGQSQSATITDAWLWHEYVEPNREAITPSASSDFLRNAVAVV
jgi:hypothetical protein